MRTTIRIISAACAGMLLLACGSVVAPPPPAAQQLRAPAEADRYYALGRSQHAAQRYAEAMQSYRQALQLDPLHVNARNGLAVLYAGQGDYGKAIALWQELVDGSSGSESAFLFGNLGYAYLLSGDLPQALTALEKSCVLDPLNPQAWEHLGKVLEQLGQGERAALMFRQARTLQTHDVRSDYALLPAGSATPAAERALASHDAASRIEAVPDAAWSQTFARTEITQTGAALVQVRRVDAVVAREPVAAEREAPARGVVRNEERPHNQARLEISNGNGVTGMAAELARTVRGDDLQVVRLSNVKHFAVPVSRVEYREAQQATARALAARLGLQVIERRDDGTHAELRIVLGRDQRDPRALRRRYRASADGGGMVDATALAAK